MDYEQNALKLLSEAISGENSDRLFYSYLIEAAPSQEDKELIASIRDDEMKHFELFRQIYYELVGQAPPQMKDEGFTEPASFCQGIKQALLGELGAVEKYRIILFAMEYRGQINRITEIITDELRHASLYNFIYSKNECQEDKIDITQSKK